jgi:hypothetical protein
VVPLEIVSETASWHWKVTGEDGLLLAVSQNRQISRGVSIWDPENWDMV